MIWLILIVAVSTSFWAGYLRRTMKFQETIAANLWKAENDGGQIEFIGREDGLVVVEITFKSPVIVDNLEIRRRGRWVVPAAQVEGLVAILLGALKQTKPPQ